MSMEAEAINSSLFASTDSGLSNISSWLVRTHHMMATTKQSCRYKHSFLCILSTHTKLNNLGLSVVTLKKENMKKEEHKEKTQDNPKRHHFLVDIRLG